MVHIDVDPATFGANYPTEVAVQADAKLALAALLTEIRRRGGGGGRDAARAVAAAKAAKFAAFDRLAGDNAQPILPERIVAELQAVLPADACVVADPGTPCPYVAAYLRQKGPGRRILSNRAHGALGYSMAAAVGVHYARPNSKVVSIMGDGSFGFTVGELETIARLKIPLAMIVVSNATYGWIKAGQKHGFGERYFAVDFSRTDHAAVAEAFGIKARRVTDPTELRAALAWAVEAGEPALVDVIAQPLHEARAPVSEWIA